MRAVATSSGVRAKNIRDAILGVPSSPDPAVMSISALKGLAGTKTGRANSTVGAALKPSGTVSFEALCNSGNPLTPQVLTRTLEVKARVRDTGMWTCRLCNKNFVAKTDNLKRHSASHSAKKTASTIHSMLSSARGKATDNDASTAAPTLLMSLGMAHRVHVCFAAGAAARCINAVAKNAWTQGTRAGSCAGGLHA